MQNSTFRIGLVVVIGLLTVGTSAMAQSNAGWNAFAAPADGAALTKGGTAAGPPRVLPGEVVLATVPLPSSASLFGAEEVDSGALTKDFIVGELSGLLRVWHFDENAVMFASWSTALPGGVQTGLAIENGTTATYWAVDAEGSQITQHFMGTGVPTGTACPLAGSITPGPAVVDENVPGQILVYEDLVTDSFVAIDLTTCAYVCSYSNADNAGAGAFGNGVDDAVYPYSCDGSTLVQSSGTTAEGTATRVGQYDCSGTDPACLDMWDIFNPLASFGEDFVNGIVEYESFLGSPDCRDKKWLLCVGNRTSTVYLMTQPFLLNPGIPRDPSLVAFWPLDGDGDDLGGCANGVLMGTPSPETINGKADCALRFDGVSSFIEVPNTPCLNVGTSTFVNDASFSIEGWIRTSSSQWEPIVEKRLGRTRRGYELWVLNGRLHFSICADGVPNQSWGCHGWTDLSGQLVNSGEWVHVAVVVERAGAPSSWKGKFYVDGELSHMVDNSNGRVPAGSVANSAPLWIGKDRLSQFFDGDLDEISLYDGAIPDAYIREIYQAGAVGKMK